MIVQANTGYLGPYKSIQTQADRLRCTSASGEQIDLCFTVIGDYTVHTNDALMPPAPPPPVPVPQVVTMRQARLALLGAGLLPIVDAAVIAAGEAAKIEWDYATEVHRDHALLQSLTEALGMTSAEVDALFVTASSL